MSDGARKKAAYLAFVLLGVIWGSNFIFMKWAAEHISASQIVLLRVVFGFLPILLVALAKRALRWEHMRHVHHFIFIRSLLRPCTPGLCQGAALLPSSIGAVERRDPLFSFICAWLFLSEERINMPKAAGVALCFSACCSLLVPGPARADRHRRRCLHDRWLAERGSSFVYAGDSSAAEAPAVA